MKKIWEKVTGAAKSFFEGLFKNTKAGAKNVGKLARAIANGIVDAIKGIIEVAEATMTAGKEFDGKTTKEFLKYMGTKAVGFIVAVLLVWSIFAVILPAVIVSLSKIILYVAMVAMIIAFFKIMSDATTKWKMVTIEDAAGSQQPEPAAS